MIHGEEKTTDVGPGELVGISCGPRRFPVAEYEHDALH